MIKLNLYFSHIVFLYLILFVENISKFLVEKEKNPTIAFGDSYHVSVTNSAQNCSDWPKRPHCLANYLQKLS